MKNFSALTIVVAFTLVISGCSSVPDKPKPGSSSNQINTTDHWRARGKFSYRSSETTESGNFDWRQQGKNYKLRLYGPLGIGSVRISGNPNLVRIQTGDYDISSDQPLSLLYRLTGLEIPLNSMSMWLTGNPSSLSPSNITFNHEGQIDGFTERNWLLSYSDFKELDNQQIPTTINAHKDGINLRMLVYSWKVFE